MKRVFLTAVILFMVMMPHVSWAVTSPYPDPNRQTAWNSFTDAIHTFGQNSKQTKATIQKLHSARFEARNQSIYLANKAKMKAWQKSQEQQ